MRHRARKGGDLHHIPSSPLRVNSSGNCKEFDRKMEQHPSQVVADFYDASLDPTRWPQALLALGELANADMVALAVRFRPPRTGDRHSCRRAVELSTPAFALQRLASGRKSFSSGAVGRSRQRHHLGRCGPDVALSSQLAAAGPVVQPPLRDPGARGQQHDLLRAGASGRQAGFQRRDD